MSEKITITEEDVIRLHEIVGEIESLANEAKDIIRKGPSHLMDEAMSYPLGHIFNSLTDDRSTGMTPTLEHIADKLDTWVDDEDDDEEE